MFQISGIIVIGERIFGIHRHLRERDQIEGAIETEPVSYTHLDVYKRQDIRHKAASHKVVIVYIIL